MGATPRYLPRAERYTLPIAILYRSAGETEWRPGLTENISRTGVLFRTDRRLEPNTALEMMLDIPAVVSSYQSGSALRRGRVVRSLPPTAREKRPAVAAAFIDFQYAPPIDPRRI